MNPTTTAVRAGWARGLIELRQSFTNGHDLFSHLFWPTLMLVVMYFTRDVTLGAGGLVLGTLMLPSVLGMNAAMGMVAPLPIGAVLGSVFTSARSGPDPAADPAACRMTATAPRKDQA
ncbi:hypothetical protein [Nonomuraea dietziae]|uniref:Uncharacterized protein n=1 Tax=Nonomuraea dietziae TaxID=65515 RepID=A0A7W5Y799_9ACTN|nr:hypothetical protein [Nonomuraea dietziae]MBB3727053.1 hypothetical protein [Nonomuraea dietziae]